MTPEVQAFIFQVIDKLGFTAGMMIAGGLFIYKLGWPWFTKHMDKYVDVMQSNAAAMQTTTAALSALSNQIQQQPNKELAHAVTTLVERMDAQHVGLSQQLASTESKILMAIGHNHRERADDK